MMVSNSSLSNYIENFDAPFVGAQVFIEPGQTAEEIDGWFKTMKDHHMTFCRIRMFEAYMKKADGTWDFTLFDHAFRSAEKHGIKVLGTIFPYTEKTDIGGFKFPRDDEHLQSIAEFIQALTTHFRSYSSLYGWVLINEPGVGGRIPWTEFTKKKYEEWKVENPAKDFTDKGYPVLMDLQEEAFLLDYNTWFLDWIASEIKRHDPGRHLHVNNHAMFGNVAEYDFPAWRNFLNSLGGSAHASWHFGYFTRQKYALAMSANSEIVRSGAGALPWLMTELQGGNNTYSGINPMNPTQEEIVQWLWIVTAAEGRGSIFWSLNPRSSGIEAGEWALLDFQNNPSDRMKSAAKVAETLQKHAELFNKAKEVESKINMVYVRESLWAESKMATGSVPNYQARNIGGVMKSMLGYFEALSEMGINSNIKAIEEFDFSRKDFSGETIILAHQISIPTKYVESLERFVNLGGKLIVDGLTGYFDENLHNTLKTGFAFEKLFGGNISEFKVVDNVFDVQIHDKSIPAHLWRGYISNHTGEVLARHDGQPIGIRNKLGRGEVVWVPSLLGLGSRINNDYSSLAGFLEKELQSNLKNFPIRFKTLQKNMLMKNMVVDGTYISVIVNKSEKTGVIDLLVQNPNLKPVILYQNKSGKITNRQVEIFPEETLVISWR